MTTIADMVRTIARIGAAARRFGDALRRWSPTPPAAFVKRAAQLRERGGTPDHLDMVRLFALAAPPAEWRDRPGRRRTGWLKHAGNRYIAKCLHHAAGIPGWTVRSGTGRATLAEAMGEAFGEDARTIERAWQEFK